MRLWVLLAAAADVWWAGAKAEEPVCEWKTPATGPEVCFVTLMDNTVSYWDAIAACPAHGHLAYLARFPDRKSFDEVKPLNLMSAGAQYWTSLFYQPGLAFGDISSPGSWKWGDLSADTWVRLSSTSGCGYVDASGGIQSQNCTNQLTGYICQRAAANPALTTAVPTTTQGTTTSEPTSSQDIMTSEPTTSQDIMTSEPTTSQDTTTSEPTTSQRITTSEPMTSQGTTSEPTTSQGLTTSEPTTTKNTTTSEPTTSQGLTTSEPTTSQDTTTSEPTTSQRTTTSEPTTSQHTLTLKPTTSQDTKTSGLGTSPDTMTSEPMNSLGTMTSGPTTSKADMTAPENTADPSAKPTDAAHTSETPGPAYNSTTLQTEVPFGNNTSNATTDLEVPNSNTTKSTASTDYPNGNGIFNSTAVTDNPNGKGPSNYTTEPAPGCLDLSPCHPACENGGVCVNGACYCTDGFTGSKCHKEVHGLATKNNTVTTCEPCRCLKPAANASRYYCSQCGDPPVLPHTSVYMSTCGETVRYACLPGFLRLRGNATKTCDQERGEWPTWNHLVCRNASAEEQKVEIFVPKEELTEDEQFQAKIGWKAADSRPTAIGLGSAVGITFVGILVVAVVVMDALSLAEHVRGCRQNLRGQRPRRVKVAKAARK